MLGAMLVLVVVAARSGQKMLSAGKAAEGWDKAIGGCRIG